MRRNALADGLVSRRPVQPGAAGAAVVGRLALGAALEADEVLVAAVDVTALPGAPVDAERRDGVADEGGYELVCGAFRAR